MHVIPAIRLLSALVVSMVLQPAVPAVPAVAAGPWTGPIELARAASIVHDVDVSGGGMALAAALAGGELKDGIYVGTPAPTERIVGRDRAPAVATESSGARTITRVVWTDGDAVWLARDDTGQWVSSRLWLGRARLTAIATRGEGLAVAFSVGSGVRFLTWDPVTGPTAAQVVTPSCSRCEVRALDIAWRGGTPWIAIGRDLDRTRWRPALHLAHRAAGGPWRSERVDAHLVYGGALAIAADGDPLLVYGRIGSRSEYPVGIWLARRSHGEWSRRRIFGATGGEPAIAADRQGRILAGVPRAPFDGPCAENSGDVVVRRVDIRAAARTIPGSHISGACVVDLQVGLLGGAPTATWVTHEGGFSDEPYDRLWFSRR